MGRALPSASTWLTRGVADTVPAGASGPDEVQESTRRSVDHLADFALDDELKLVVCAGVGEVVPQAAVFVIGHGSTFSSDLCGPL